MPGDVAQDADPSVQPEAAGDVSPAPGIVEEPLKPKTALQLELEKAQQTTPDFNQWVALEKMTETEVSPVFLATLPSHYQILPLLCYAQHSCTMLTPLALGFCCQPSTVFADRGEQGTFS